MDNISTFLQSLIPAGFDFQNFFKTLLILTAAVLIMGLLARLLFGKKSLLNRSLSSAISILFIYIITVCIHSLGVNLQFLLSPLPFVSIRGEYLYISTELSQLATHLLSMVSLSFLANLADSWLPDGKGVLGWFFFRCISVLLAMLLHLITISIINALLPSIILLWTPRILLIALGLMIFLGLLKVPFAVTNPLFAALHNFFFKHTVGKMIYRGVLTTIIIATVVYTLNFLGINTIYIASGVLISYLPILLILLGIWFLIGHLL